MQGLAEVIAGVALLATYASSALGWGFTLVIGGAVWVSVGELFMVSLFIRARHRITRSALGRLYGFRWALAGHPGCLPSLVRLRAGSWPTGLARWLVLLQLRCVCVHPRRHCHGVATQLHRQVMHARST